MTVDPADLAVWTEAWAISRGLCLPAPAFGGWFLHVGQPDQVSRYVFPTLDPARLRSLGAAIHEPHVLIKVPAKAAAVQAALGPDWDAVRTGWFMHGPLPDASATSGDGVTITHEDGPTRQYRLHVDGAEAARARLTIIGERAIVDSVDTEPAYRRRGLASALMRHLAAEARGAGATTGLLTSTDAGLMVYERLGWAMLSPWTTAQLARRR